MSLYDLPLKYINPNLLKKKIADLDFYEFVKQAWDSIESDEFLDGWYIKAECVYAQAVYEGKMRNLIVNVPPRTLKSTIFSVMFPAWVLAKNPKKKFMCASYSATLSNDIHGKCRRLIESTWYKETYPNVKLVKNREDYFQTSEGGYRLALGVDGAGTGFGCDYFIGDDLLKPKDALSDAIREKTNAWFDETITTRRNNINTGARIVVCQRLHEGDIVGHLDSKSTKWEKLILPLEYEGINFTSSIGFIDPRTEIGESLHPARFSKESIKELKSDLGEYASAGQLQQRPSLIKGNIFKKEFFINRLDNYDIIARFISADTAQSVKVTADPNALIVGEITSDYKLFIRDVSNKRLDFTDLQGEIERLATKYKYKLKGIIIESKSSGISLQQSITRTSPEWIKNLVVPFNPTSDKVTRFFQAAVWCEKGCVLLPPPTENYPWLYDFEEELFKVPNTKHDDQADSFSQLITYLELYLERGFKYRNGVFMS